MSQCDDAFVSVARIQKVWNEGEDFWGDLVDWCRHFFPYVFPHVFQHANQAEELGTILLGSVGLEHNTYQLQSARRFRWFIQPRLHLWFPAILRN